MRNNRPTTHIIDVIPNLDSTDLPAVLSSITPPNEIIIFIDANNNHSLVFRFLANVIFRVLGQNSRLFPQLELSDYFDSSAFLVATLRVWFLIIIAVMF